MEYGLRFYSGDQHIELFNSDSAAELADAAQNCGYLNQESAPYEPQSNGAIEVFVRLTKYGARSTILQSGLGHKWWPKASQH